jgi:hypothetical protein
VARFIDKHGVFPHGHRPAGDRKNIYVLGAGRVAEQCVTSRDNHDIGFEHRRYGTHSGEGVRARGSTRSGDVVTPATDVALVLPCDLMAMNNNGYPAIWSAKLVTLTQMQVAAIEPVNVLMRVVYNTLDGIVNDYFVITASVAKR